jgi:hypothetical protein
MPAASSGVTWLALRQIPNRPSRLASTMPSLLVTVRRVVEVMVVVRRGHPARTVNVQVCAG